MAAFQPPSALASDGGGGILLASAPCCSPLHTQADAAHSTSPFY